MDRPKMLGLLGVIVGVLIGATEEVVKMIGSGATDEAVKMIGSGATDGAVTKIGSGSGISTGGVVDFVSSDPARTSVVMDFSSGRSAGWAALSKRMGSRWSALSVRLDSSFVLFTCLASSEVLDGDVAPASPTFVEISVGTSDCWVGSLLDDSYRTGDGSTDRGGIGKCVNDCDRWTCAR